MTLVCTGHYVEAEAGQLVAVYCSNCFSNFIGFWPWEEVIKTVQDSGPILCQECMDRKLDEVAEENANSEVVLSDRL
jgi:hypothetical protein